jgi:pyridoxal phosphate enzyme (YggS family)
VTQGSDRVQVEGTLAGNLLRARAAITEACERARRDSGAVRLVAVTKTVPIDRISAAAALGLQDFGENRMQEALPKVAALPHLCWHFVGHLQTNKARALQRGFQWLQACDSLRLAQVVAAQQPEGLQVLLEVNVAGDPRKFGFAPTDLHQQFPSVLELGLRVRGLMTIAPMTAHAEQVRPYFRALRLLRDELAQRSAVALPELSMGMTDDYAVAVEEGATMVRLGRALFGERPSDRRPKL